MGNNKLNLVLDFNNLAMRALYTCQFYEANVDIRNFDTDEECGVFVRKLMFDITYIIRTFSPDRVIFACDARYPWRNQLYEGLDIKYKGNREKDEAKNWDKIYEKFDDVKNILASKNFVISELDKTEADDLAALWKEELFDKNDESVVLVSSDKDWTQLISFNQLNHSFCACFNPIANPKKQKKFYMTESMEDWLNEPDQVDIFFNNYDVMKKKVNTIVQSDAKITIESIDPERVLLDKVMCGDDGDNVPAFFEYYKNGRKTRVTPLKASHVFESLNIHNIDDLIKNNDDHMLKDALEKEMKRDVDVDFDERLYRQRRMVELKSYLFPEEIVNMFSEHKGVAKDVGYYDSMSSMKMEDILRGTKYVDDDYQKKVKESAIFNDFKSLTNFSDPHKLF